MTPSIILTTITILTAAWLSANGLILAVSVRRHVRWEREACQ